MNEMEASTGCVMHFFLPYRKGSRGTSLLRDRRKLLQSASTENDCPGVPDILLPCTAINFAFLKHDSHGPSICQENWDSLAVEVRWQLCQASAATGGSKHPWRNPQSSHSVHEDQVQI